MWQNEIGSKGYSCCARRVLEFDEFLKIPPCRPARHLFVGGGSPQSATQRPTADAAVKKIRHDFYQTPTHIILSYYCPKVDKAASVVRFDTQQVVFISKYDLLCDIFWLDQILIIDPVT